MVKARRIEIDGDKLRADRMERRWKIWYLAELCGVSYDLVADAEKGHCTKANLYILAEKLHQSPDRYKISSDMMQGHQVANLQGIWDTYYLEKETGAPAYLVKDKLKITQDGRIIYGLFSPGTSDNPDNYQGTQHYKLEGKIQDNFIIGSYTPNNDSSKFPQGMGVFQLKIMRSSMWLEGFLTFYSDIGSIAVSHTIWIRYSSIEYKNLTEVAKRIIKMTPIFIEAPLDI